LTGIAASDHHDVDSKCPSTLLSPISLAAFGTTAGNTRGETEILVYVKSYCTNCPCESTDMSSSLKGCTALSLSKVVSRRRTTELQNNIHTNSVGELRKLLAPAMYPRENNYLEYFSLGQEYKQHYGFEEKETERKRGGKKAAKK
jgi:hypothetical protein